MNLHSFSVQWDELEVLSLLHEKFFYLGPRRLRRVGTNATIRAQVRARDMARKGQARDEGCFSLLHTGRLRYMAGTSLTSQGRGRWHQVSRHPPDTVPHVPPCPAATLHKLSSCRPGAGATEAVPERKQRYQGAHAVAHK